VNGVWGESSRPLLSRVTRSTQFPAPVRLPSVRTFTLQISLKNELFCCCFVISKWISFILDDSASISAFSRPFDSLRPLFLLSPPFLFPFPFPFLHLFFPTGAVTSLLFDDSELTLVAFLAQTSMGANAKSLSDARFEAFDFIVDVIKLIGKGKYRYLL